MYPMAKSDTVQRFPLPGILCVGGMLRVELLGRTQKQTIDDQFYSEFCGIEGKVAYHCLCSCIQACDLIL